MTFKDWWELAAEAGWTVTSVAKMLGVSRQTVHRWIGGGRPRDWVMVLNVEILTDGAVTAEDWIGDEAGAVAPKDWIGDEDGADREAGDE